MSREGNVSPGRSGDPVAGQRAAGGYWLELPGLQGREMRQSLLTPSAMIGVLWKAVCSETGLYSLGRGQRRRAGNSTSPVPYFIRGGVNGKGANYCYLASHLLHFEEHPQLVTEREKLWRLIRETPHLNWLLLTKRPQNVLTMTPWKDGAWPDNMWIGTSAGNQQRANERLPLLVQIPAVVKFVSYEPALEQVDFTPWLQDIDWLICGGESGALARPFELAWARKAREQCQEAGVKFFFKQVGGRYHNSGGRLLDGRTWDELPPEKPKRVMRVEP